MDAREELEALRQTQRDLAQQKRHALIRVATEYEEKIQSTFPREKKLLALVLSEMKEVTPS